MDKSDIEFIGRCRSDFLFFCENVLNLELSSFHREIAALPFTHRYLCIVLPTGHSKTTLYSIAYPIWRLFREKNFEMCLTSSSVEQSMKILNKVQETLEAEPFFSSILPNNRFDTWNKSILSTSNGNKYYIKPFNSTARGIHPNLIVYDDLLREMDTPMEVIKETFWGIYYPRGQIHNCQHIVVGTPQSVDDLYSDFEKKTEWTVMRKAAVVENAKGEWVKPLWAERFPLSALRKIREDMGDYRFEREFMCRPKSTGDTLYPMEMLLNCLDEGLEYSYALEGITTIGADFAMSTAASGDFNVFTVVDSLSGKSYTKHTDKGDITIENPVMIRRIIRFRGNTGHIDNLKSLHNYFPNSRIIADSSGVGAKFVQELRENSISVDAQDFRPENRNMLLMNLRRLIEQNRLVIPNKGELVPLSDRLLKELSSFHSVKTQSGRETWVGSVDHDDMVMSLALAVKDIGSPRKTMQNLFFGA